MKEVYVVRYHAMAFYLAYLESKFHIFPQFLFCHLYNFIFKALL